VVETDTAATRSRYLAALAQLQDLYKETLLARGGRLVCASTADDPVAIVRSVVTAVR
jgi:L-lactate utilization protein LutB